tara:strand:+ start:467 stop:631 length:165 start_codon:yes stop_codon:yes gene_type:complete
MEREVVFARKPFISSIPFFIFGNEYDRNLVSGLSLAAFNPLPKLLATIIYKHFF